jgi:hypothetical protein
MSEPRMRSGEFSRAAKLILKIPCGYRERFVAEARRTRRIDVELRRENARLRARNEELRAAIGRAASALFKMGGSAPEVLKEDAALAAVRGGP